MVALVLALVAAGTPAGPDAVVKDFYELWLHDKQSAAMDQHAAPALLAAWRVEQKRAKEAKGEICGILESDPFTNAQDVGETSFGKAAVDGDRARVPVSVKIGADEGKLTVLLNRHDGRWKIADVEYAPGDTLLARYAKVHAEKCDAPAAE